jgi:transcriptional regulator with XRE-family HTH domain
MTGLLRAVRKQRGLTLAILAEQTGLTKSYLSKIERQQSTPSIAVALKVARALDVDVAQSFADKTADEKIVVDRFGEQPRKSPASSTRTRRGWCQDHLGGAIGVVVVEQSVQDALTFCVVDEDRILVACAHLAEQGAEQAGQRTRHPGLEARVLSQ